MIVFPGCQLTALIFVPLWPWKVGKKEKNRRGIYVDGEIVTNVLAGF